MFEILGRDFIYFREAKDIFREARGMLSRRSWDSKVGDSSTEFNNIMLTYFSRESGRSGMNPAIA